MRLIDADTLLDRIPKVDLDHEEKITRSGAIMDMICMVDTAPTVEVPRWIPVTPETMPRERQKVLCKCRAGIYDIMVYDYQLNGWKPVNYVGTLYMCGYVTHWMPLPEVNDHA